MVSTEDRQREIERIGGNGEHGGLGMGTWRTDQKWIRHVGALELQHGEFFHRMAPSAVDDVGQ